MRVLFPPLADEIRQLCEGASIEFVIVSPWIKNNALHYILDQESLRAAHYRILTVGDLRNFLNGSSDIAAIEMLLQLGADIRLVSNLHAKIYIADRTSVIVASANLTQSGLEDNLELGVFIDREKEVKALVRIVEGWFSKAQMVDTNWLSSVQHAFMSNRAISEKLQEVDRRLRQVSDNLRGQKITLPKPKRSVKKAPVLPRIVQRDGWAREIEQWSHIKFNTELSQEFVRFFQLAFEWLPNKTLREAWFGVHSDRISLTVGNIWLASVWVGKPKEPVWAPKRTVWLLVADSWDDLAKSTQKYAPLGWKVYSWEQITDLNDSKEIWKSYASAAKKVWASPIARLAISKNLANKQKVCNLGLAAK